MSLHWIPEVLVGLAPVLAFLAALLYLDSYKLVNLRTVVAVVLCGALTAVTAYHLNGWLIGSTGLEFRSYSRYVAPVLEEALKGAIVILLIRFDRIGFLVDAAIHGFAVGAGFALVENAYYFTLLQQDAGLGTWIIRGFGTAIMHGGVTAIFSVLALDVLDRPGHWWRPVALLPPLLLAAAIHSAYNHALLPPLWQTLAVLVLLPTLLWFVFERSEKALGDWLGRGFDNDAQLLEQINSGQLGNAPLGQYLATLRDKFPGPVVVDLLCYVRVHTELALRAKGILMMRENGFEVPIDDATRETFAELRYLEGSIGVTGHMAIRPMLQMSRKDLRQLYLIE